MGMYLSMAGTPVDEDATQAGLEQVRSSGAFGDFQFWCEESTKHRTLALFEDDNDHVEAICQALSKLLGTPVFYLHIHDGSAWLYSLYHKGERVDRFSQVPEFVALDPEDDIDAWRGNAKLIATLWPELRAQDIANYLVFQHDLHSEKKAYRDDEFDPYDCWQICDFMNRLGLEYPDVEGDDEEESDEDNEDWDDDERDDERDSWGDEEDDMSGHDRD